MTQIEMKYIFKTKKNEYIYSRQPADRHRVNPEDVRISQDILGMILFLYHIDKAIYFEKRSPWCSPDRSDEPEINLFYYRVHFESVSTEVDQPGWKPLVPIVSFGRRLSASPHSVF